ncbi:MAG: flagellar biosynthesis regulator FlaF [Hyphomicrobium sp.]|nr:flagellar biosynthesis regulator FlaF [Hyphomicrobium sp.]
MYASAYAEISAASGQEGRAAEREALLRSIEFMQRAEASGPLSRESVEAIHVVVKLWSRLIEDLGRPENGLPAELRASLISIGFFLIKAAGEIRTGERQSFAALIEVTGTIVEGLKP